MPTTQAEDLLRRLRKGDFNPSDPLYLEQARADDLIVELAVAHPIRFQERRLKSKWEVGLARSVDHRLVLRRLRRSPFMVGEVLPVLRHCLLLSGEGDAVTGWSLIPQIQVRRGVRGSAGLTLVTSSGYKLDRFPDGWEMKPLAKKKTILTEDFLSQRGWQFDALLPLVQAFGQKSPP